MKKSAFVGALFLLGLTAACSSKSASGTGGSGATGAGGSGAGGKSAPLGGTVARGQYLVDHLLVCSECHTPNGADGRPDTTKYLAGSRNYDFVTPNGTVSVYAENLTSHAVEGLGGWSDADIRRGLTMGIDDEQVALWPIMPYPEYSLMTADDVDSIIQYLRTVPANGNVVAADTLPDPSPPAPQVKDSDIPHTTLPASDPGYPAAERGRYLAAIACVQCHTPQITAGVPDFTKAFAGGRPYTPVQGQPPQTSTNITPAASGLAGWTVDDIIASIKTNTDKSGRALCSTMPGGAHKMGDLAMSDLTDIATYIHTVPAIENGPFTCLAP